MNNLKNINKHNIEKPTYTSNSVKVAEDDGIVEIKLVPHEIGQALAISRIKQRLSRRDIAKQVGIKEDTLAHIECGRAIFDQNQINKIKKVLGCN
jgi:ribosome-binding protein aMBF1 (putative translation factor)